MNKIIIKQLFVITVSIMMYGCNGIKSRKDIKKHKIA